MQKFRIQSKYNKETNLFEKNDFEITEMDKIIYGRISVASKKNDKYISKTIPFIAFKSKITQETKDALLNSRGGLFDADFSLMVDQYDKPNGEGSNTILKVVIIQAKFEDKFVEKNIPKENNNSTTIFIDDEIVF